MPVSSSFAWALPVHGRLPPANRIASDAPAHIAHSPASDMQSHSQASLMAASTRFTFCALVRMVLRSFWSYPMLRFATAPDAFSAIFLATVASFGR